MIQVKFKRMSGEEFELSVDTDWTGQRLKEEIAGKINVAAGRLRLILLGRALKDEQPLHEFDVRENQTIHIVEREAEQAPPPQPEPPRATQIPLMMGGFSVSPDGQQPLGGLDIPNILQSFLGAARGVQQAAQQQPQAPPSTAPQPAQQQQQPPQAQQPQAPAQQQQRPQTQTPPPQAPPQPGQGPTPAGHAHMHVHTHQQRIVQGVHVVVHATPADLETLPQRLAAFQREIEQSPGSTPITLVGSGSGGPQRAQGPMSQVISALDNNVGSLLQSVGPVIQQATHFTTQAASQMGMRPPSGAAPPATPSPADSSRGASAAPQAAQGQTAAPAQARTQPAGPTRLLHKVANKAMSKLTVPELLSLPSGNVAVLDKVEGDVVPLVKAELGEDTDARREAFVQGAADEVVAKMRQNQSVMEVLRKEGVDADAVLQETGVFVRYYGGDMLRVVLGDRQGRGFGEAVVGVMKRGVGHWIERMRGRFPLGVADAQNVIFHALQQEIREAVPHMPPAYAPIAASPMVLGFLRNFISTVHPTYMTTCHSPQADSRLGLGPVPPSAFTSVTSSLTPTEQAQLEASISTVASAPTQPLSNAYRAGDLQ